MPKARLKVASAGRAPVAVTNCIHRLEPRDRRLVARALRVLEDSAVYRSEAFTSPSAVRDHLKLRFAGLEREEFHILWLDAQNYLISAERLFAGTLTQTAIYPREVIKAALAHNAGAVILAHNHPSGLAEPSTADHALTEALKAALAVVDVKVLDHIIVAGTDTLSFADRGLL